MHLKLSILPSPHYFFIILNLVRYHQTDLFGSWRVHAHVMNPPVSGPDYVSLSHVACWMANNNSVQQ